MGSITVIAVDQPTLELALAKSGYDFEDDLQITCAEIAHVDGIVTRDPKGFVYSTVPIFTLNEAIKQFAV